MQLVRTIFPIVLLCLLSACRDSPITPVESSEEDLDKMQTTQDQDVGPVTDCDESLSAFELQEMWEMMNAEVHDKRHICFEGYVLSNETYGDLIQGSIALRPINGKEVNIPAVYCQFTGMNGKTFLDYEIGDPIKIMGKLAVIDNEEKHNFMFAKCSLPAR